METDNGVDYEFFARELLLPRLFADRSTTDFFGGFSLDSQRSEADIQRQRLLLGPGLEVTGYDDSGWEAYCSVETWVNDDQTFEVGRFVAREGGRVLEWEVGRE